LIEERGSEQSSFHKFRNNQGLTFAGVIQKIVCISLFVSLGAACDAAFEDVPVGARAHAMSNATSAVWDAFSLYTNPSALSLNSGFSVATFGTELFGEPDLVFVCSEVNVGRFGAYATSFGNRMYRESILGLGCGFYAYGMSFGVSAKGMVLSIMGYGSDATFGLDAGVLGVVDERLSISAAGKNINLPTLGSSEEELPTVLTIGSAMYLADRFVLCIDVRKERRQGLEISLGQELFIYPHFCVRSGLSTDPSMFSAGFGLILARLAVDYSVRMHHPLGLTHGLTLGYKIDRR
jgi:hypothetical protein